MILNSERIQSYSIVTIIIMITLIIISKLDLVIDAENQSPKHLGQIANSMYEWEGVVADQLGLTPADVAAIKTQYPTQLKLQV